MDCCLGCATSFVHCSQDYQLPSGAVPTISSPVVQYPPSAPQWCSTHYQLPSGAVPTISCPVVQYPPSAPQWCSTHHQLPSGAVPTISSPVVQYPLSVPKFMLNTKEYKLQTRWSLLGKNIINNGLFMAPHLVRAWNTYTDIRI